MPIKRYFLIGFLNALAQCCVVLLFVFIEGEERKLADVFFLFNRNFIHEYRLP
jgi:hypothetical protein